MPKIGNRKENYAPKDDQYTPKWLFDRIGTVFDLDVASPKNGSAVPCRKWYSQEDDGLVQPWFGFVWMNPPYSEPALWVQKFIDHGNGMALLPMSKSKWAYDLWQSASAITYIGKIKFDQMDGKQTEIFMPVLLYGMGERAKQTIKRTELGRVR